MTSVILADDQELVRSGFRLILELPDFDVSARRPTAARRSSWRVRRAPTSC